MVWGALECAAWSRETGDSVALCICEFCVFCVIHNVYICVYCVFVYIVYIVYLYISGIVIPWDRRFCSTVDWCILDNCPLQQKQKCTEMYFVYSVYLWILCILCIFVYIVCSVYLCLLCICIYCVFGVFCVFCVLGKPTRTIFPVFL